MDEKYFSIINKSKLAELLIRVGDSVTERE